MANNQGSKSSPGKIVGGLVLILFALVGGYANLGRNPASNLSTILVMGVLILVGLWLLGVRLGAKKK